MAKQVASATAAADMSTASEVIGMSVGDTLDNIPSGTGVAITDGQAVQGEVNTGNEVRDTFEMPVKDKNGEVVSTIMIQRF